MQIYQKLSLIVLKKLSYLFYISIAFILSKNYPIIIIILHKCLNIFLSIFWINPKPSILFIIIILYFLIIIKENQYEKI